MMQTFVANAQAGESDSLYTNNFARIGNGWRTIMEETTGKPGKRLFAEYKLPSSCLANIFRFEFDVCQTKTVGSPPTTVSSRMAPKIEP